MTERTEGCGTKATLTGQREAGRVDKWKRQKQEQWRTGVGGKLRRQIDETKRRDQERERGTGEAEKSILLRHVEETLSFNLFWRRGFFTLCLDFFTRTSLFPSKLHTGAAMTEFCSSFSSAALPRDPVSVCVCYWLFCTAALRSVGGRTSQGTRLQTGHIKRVKEPRLAWRVWKHPTHFLSCHSLQVSGSECIFWKHKVGKESCDPRHK